MLRDPKLDAALCEAERECESVIAVVKAMCGQTKVDNMCSSHNWRCKPVDAGLRSQCQRETNFTDSVYMYMDEWSPKYGRR